MISKDFRIRAVKRNELAGLKQIAESTFFDTYAADNTEADMAQYLQENFNSDILKKQFDNPDILFYFAEVGDVITGYLKLNLGKAQTDDVLKDAMEIERIYVVKEYQGNKIGNKMLSKSFEIARSLELEAVWLGVWDLNTLAIEFYLKNDFVKFAKHTFMVGTDLQNDTLMKYDLI